MKPKKVYTVCTVCGKDEPEVSFPTQRSKNAGKCVGCQSDAHKQWYKDRGQDYFLGKKFGPGIVELYEKLAVGQGHVCKLCHTPETAEDARTGIVRRLSVDHDHTQERSDGTAPLEAVRGLLCRACNQGLGSFRDNPDRMRAAALYVEAHRVHN